ncbi:MAG: dTMP kinase [Coriobacteriales bacterium]|jgi:dTMP kinase|nr:dTMP kinase [Coriobacteriales bacterium]
MSDRPGILISFEGGEGVGKSTHIRLLAARLEASGYEVLILREPGGTAIGEKIRDLLLDPENTEMDPLTELLLYEAARAQIVAEHIIPALQRGVVVLLDRFTDSTLAYQGYGRDLPLQQVREANAIGSHGLLPDRTILLVDGLTESLQRAIESGADRLEAEGLEFHQRVANGFQALLELGPERIRLIPSQHDKRMTAELIVNQLADLFTDLKEDYELSDDLLASARREQTRKISTL